jgi:hypothetical protein
VLELLRTALFVFGGLIAAGLAWLVLRRQRRLGGDIEEAESRLARRHYRLQSQLGTLEARVRELEFEARKARGQVRFDPDMTIREILAVHPRTREILAAYGVLRPVGSVDEEATLRRVCRERSLDAALVLDTLRRFAADPARPGEKSGGARPRPPAYPPPPSRN